MNLAICSLASGSSGNCYVVRGGDTFVLVDAGISGRQIRVDGRTYYVDAYGE